MLVHRLGGKTKEEKSCCLCLNVPTFEIRNHWRQKMAVVRQQVVKEAALAFIVKLNNKSIEMHSLTQAVVDTKS